MAVILETLRLRSLLGFALLQVIILIIFFVVGGKIGECVPEECEIELS